MITIKNIADLQKLDPGDPSRVVMSHLIQQFHRDPASDGYLVLIQKGDTYVDLPELQRQLSEIQWEGVTKRGGYYYAVYLCNNQFALEFLIQDEPWLPEEIRENLEIATG